MTLPKSLLEDTPKDSPEDCLERLLHCAEKAPEDSSKELAPQTPKGISKGLLQTLS